MSTNKGGLEGVVAATSAICEVDGIQGKLSYRGMDARDLAANSTFEETAYLLWKGELPNHTQLRDLEERLSSVRDLQPGVLRMILGFPQNSRPMDALRTAVSALAIHDPNAMEHSFEADLGRAISLTARIPVIVAAHHRARQKLIPISPRRDLNLAGNFLYMLNGQIPTEKMSRALDASLILHADHELNASTFAARVAAATLTDIYSSVTAAIGTLAGPLHGGANVQVMELLQTIDDPARVEDFVLGRLAHDKRIPGFGHRVYRTVDPRAAEHRRMAELLAEETGVTRWSEISRKIEEIMMREKGLHANVDFYSGSVYHILGIPTDLFTPVFAVSRITGWTAHILEQYSNNRLIRPRAEYVGARDVPYVAMSERSGVLTAA